MSDNPPPLVPVEGWHVMHLYYSVDHSQWSLLSEAEQRQAKTELSELVQEIRSHKDTQLLIFVRAGWQPFRRASCTHARFFFRRAR